MKKIAALLALSVLAGCATTHKYDETYTAVGQSSRARFLVLHYTVANKADSIKILTQQQVSSHYLLTDDAQPITYRLVDETRTAYHAGLSAWKNHAQLNYSSVGIEIVNKGWVDTPQGRVFAPFTPAQVEALVPLVRDIVQRNGIAPENVLAHSDIAPLRKQDPGPLFPWKRLADEGLVVWPDATRLSVVRPIFEAQLPAVSWFQKKLAVHGFNLSQSGIYDEPTRTVVAAFQMKYRPANYSGVLDAETASMLEVLTTPANAPLPVVEPETPVTPEPVVVTTP